MTLSLLQFFSNLLGKALIVSDQNPLPCVHVSGAGTFDPGSPAADENPVPCEVA